MALSITGIIKKHLKDNGITQAHLATALQESPQNLGNKLKKHDLNTDYVRRISLALRYNFFQELSRQLKTALSEHAGPAGTDKPGVQESDIPYLRQQEQFQDRYIALLEENNQLHRELKQLRENMSPAKDGGAA